MTAITAIKSSPLDGWLFQMLRLWVGFATLIGSTSIMLDLSGAKHSAKYSLQMPQRILDFRFAILD
ncbi:hypothetical protein [Nostoc sp.]|uniref:hypothetical protein n=1 Tax=Nostoc sp. TaxID=1180 RepID=UPI002FF9C838